MDKNPLFLLYLFVFVFMMMMMCCLIMQIVLNYRHRKKLEELSLYRTSIHAPINKEIPELLDLVIQDCFRDYMVTTLIPLNEEYITDEREAEIRSALVKLVAERVSPVAMQKIQLFYNAEHLADKMADSIYTVVMHYVADHNKQYYEQANSSGKK